RRSGVVVTGFVGMFPLLVSTIHCSWSRHYSSVDFGDIIDYVHSVLYGAVPGVLS
ncbi:30610_t:CDS:2, partial [Racocetra persica]